MLRLRNIPSDKKAVYIFSIILVIALLPLLALIKPIGRLIAVALLGAAAVIAWLFIKKRNILSINKKAILLIMSVSGLLYVVLYYLSGLSLGFSGNPYSLSGKIFFYYIIPIAAIIVLYEFVRSILQAQNDRFASCLAFFAGVIVDILISNILVSLRSFNGFMDLVGCVIFPALTANLLYNYVSKRYGMYPNIIYRSIITLSTYIFNVIPLVPDSLYSFAALFVPLIIYYFIDLLYEKKHRNAVQKPSKWRYVPLAAFIVFVIFTAMLISNRFGFGTYVIATESMTGEINKGDVVIYDEYDGEILTVGQVIAFERNDSVFIHRVIDIENINGVNRYYTKGDANEDPDDGFVTDGDILGIIKIKMPYVGYPTIWVNSLFS